MEWVRVKLGYDGVLSVEPQGRSGGLAILWKDVVHAKLLSFSQNHVDMEVVTNGMMNWRLTGFYGEPMRHLRKRTWDLLRNLSRDSNLPWCVVGDMNNITSQVDTRGGANYPRWLIDGFNETISEVRLTGMDLVGHQYTWEKGRGTQTWIETRMDRALASKSWFDMFPLAKLYTWRIVKDSWNANSNSSIVEKIQRCGERLGPWGKDVTGKFRNRIK
ncbi:uncharacterized protein LOC141686040 [Apium graveolens]|uniref:uncharacterized protein LOC141686040 n=1 Tax=Apium graveolens TaxID=4045 RepID=UPI003D7B50AF